MGLTERHWFENEDVPENYEWALEDAAMLKKQEPKQVIDIVGSFIEGMKTGRCPSCAGSLVNLDIDETKFCKYCGQAVKWNE